jgi:phage N-6-adenine-methyltransferase
LKPALAQEYTEALGQVFAGAVRLADVGVDLNVPEVLGLSPAEWVERRIAGPVRLDRKQRQLVVAANPDKSSRELGEALGVDHQTILNDRRSGEDSPPGQGESVNHDGQAGEDSPPATRDRSAMFMSERGDWETPQELFDELDAEFHFDLDVCATDQTAKCERYFTPANDGLAQTWRQVCWMNPPYGDTIGTWIAKAAASANEGATVVCLVPARVDTGWWWDHCRHGEVRFLRGRLRFDGGENSAPFPSAVVVLGRPARVVWWER